MKKMLLSMVAFASMAPIMGQEPQIDPISRSLTQELRALPAKDQTFEQKLSSFQKAVNYLKGARDCLKGIGCTKRQSYLANFLLGAAFSFAQVAAMGAIAKGADSLVKDPEELAGHFAFVTEMAQALGYAALTRDNPAAPIRCLTFRGCTDATKRLAFYVLGNWSGKIGAALGLLARMGGFDPKSPNYVPQVFKEEFGPRK